MKELDNQQGAADYLRVPVRTLEDWRYKGIGPAFVRVGGRAVRYRRSDIERWLTEQTIRPEDRRG